MMHYLVPYSFLDQDGRPKRPQDASARTHASGSNSRIQHDARRRLDEMTKRKAIIEDAKRRLGQMNRQRAGLQFAGGRY